MGRRPVIAVVGGNRASPLLGEGWSSELGSRALDDRRSDALVVAHTPAEAVDAAMAAIAGAR